MSHRYLIGVDMGGTNIKAGVVTLDGKVIARRRVSTNVIAGKEAVIHRVVEVIGSLLQEVNLSSRDIVAVGIGAAGLFDIRKGLVLTSPNFPGWENFPLREKVSTELENVWEGWVDGDSPRRVPVVVDNDATAAAVGEKLFGVGRNVSSLVLFTLGTGVGGGIILDGKPWRGRHGGAGELGHMTIEPAGPLCKCGNRGCLEALSSASAVARDIRERVISGMMSSVLQRVELLDEIDGKVIADAAEEGDVLAREALERAGRYLGIGIANVVNIFDPDMVVVGGGLSGAGDLIMEPAREEFRKRSFPGTARTVEIVLAGLGQDAGVVGAAACALIETGISR